MPVVVDSNSPAYWRDGLLHVVNSTGVSLVTRGADQFRLSQGESAVVEFDSADARWIESVWESPDGLLFAWYHNEPPACPDNGLTWPVIGAAVSGDGGLTYYDLGVILTAADAPDCSSKNGFFAGGHGDFSVVADTESGYFYFLFTNYGGPLEQQGVAAARMRMSDALAPVGAVEKYFEGEWTQPGLGGQVTAVFPAKTAWQASNADSHWGPSVHYNTHLGQYVALMNRACCAPRWPQEGIYVAFSANLADPAAWTQPKRILSGADVGTGGWYPQVLGLGVGETDSVAGQSARLYVKGASRWEITFDQ